VLAFFIVSSCERDFLGEAQPVKPEQSNAVEHKAIGKAIARSMVDTTFSGLLKEFLIQVESGDFEYGLTRFLNTGMEKKSSSTSQKSGTGTVLSFLVENSFGDFDEEFISTYLSNNPNLIIALRGEIISFFDDPNSAVVGVTVF